MKKTFGLCILLLVGMLLFTAQGVCAKQYGDFDVTLTEDGRDPADGDCSFESGVLTIKSNTPLTISNASGVTTTSDRIFVEKGIPANLTLNGVNINTSAGAPLEIEEGSGGNVTITLAPNSTNKLTAGDIYAALQKNGSSGTLTIKGSGSLVATGGTNGAGIGGGQSKNTANITIEGGTVTATSSNYGAGIGGGDSGASSGIMIKGGTIEASSNFGAGIGGGYGGGITSGITIITGGSIKASGAGGRSFDGAPTNGTTSVYLTTMKLVDDTDSPCPSVSVQRLGVSAAALAYGTNDMKTDDYGFIYVYLPVGTVTQRILGENHMYTHSDGLVTTDNSSALGKFVQGALPKAELTITGGTEGTDYTYDPFVGLLTIKTSKAMTIANAAGVTTTTHRIFVNAGVDADLTLKGVNIETDSGAPLEIADNSSGNVTITLESTNTLTAATYNNQAALQKNGGVNTGTLIIKGTGSLVATANSRGAGIGGSNAKNTANITIEGGEVTTDSTNGAGIGGGYGGIGSDITINGGTVEVSSDYGAGIGGGYGGIGSDITITGGTVEASSGYGAGIGGGFGGSGSGITIEGGTVKASSNSGAGIGCGQACNGQVCIGINILIKGGTIAAHSTNGEGIGGGEGGHSNSIRITGGSVKATKGNGEHGIGTPLNDDSTTTHVYLTTLTLKNGAAPIGDGVAVTDLATDPYQYGMNDVHTMDGGKIYVYLPAGTETASAAASGRTYRADPAIETEADHQNTGDLVYTAPPAPVGPDWAKVIEEIEASQPGATVTVDMLGTTHVPQAVAEALQGRDVRLALQGDAMWTIDGRDVDTPKPLDLSVGSGSPIPQALVDAAAHGQPTEQLQVGQSGDMGLTATLDRAIAGDHAGEYANIYRHVDGELTLVGAVKIGPDEHALLPFKLGGQYLLVIDPENHLTRDRWLSVRYLILSVGKTA